MIEGINMVEYRMVVDRDRCTDCGLSTGRCPTHARLLARILKENNEEMSLERTVVGVFSEEDYDQVKKLAEACPEKALIIEKKES
jgi:ferredoxin